MSFRIIATIALLAVSLIGTRCVADDEVSKFGIIIPPLVPGFPDVFGDGREGIRFASCYSPDPDAGGPAQAFLMFLPQQVLSRDAAFDAVFFWVGSDEGERYLIDWGWIKFFKDDVAVQAAQGGNWTDEAMERTIVPLLNTRPRTAYSTEDIFRSPRGRCRYAAHWDYTNPKPRHRPKIKPEWFAAAANDGHD